MKSNYKRGETERERNTRRPRKDSKEIEREFSSLLQLLILFCFLLFSVGHICAYTRCSASVFSWISEAENLHVLSICKRKQQRENRASWEGFWFLCVQYYSSGCFCGWYLEIWPGFLVSIVMCCWIWAPDSAFHLSACIVLLLKTSKRFTFFT